MDHLLNVKIINQDLCLALSGRFGVSVQLLGGNLQNVLIYITKERENFGVSEFWYFLLINKVLM